MLSLCQRNFNLSLRGRRTMSADHIQLCPFEGECVYFSIEFIDLLCKVGALWLIAVKSFKCAG